MNDWKRLSRGEWINKNSGEIVYILDFGRDAHTFRRFRVDLDYEPISNHRTLSGALRSAKSIMAKRKKIKKKIMTCISPSGIPRSLPRKWGRDRQ